MLRNGAGWRAEVPRPTHGHVALFASLDHDIDGLPYRLSTQIRQASAIRRALPV